MSMAVVFCGSVALARAEDVSPPPWQRGAPGTTTQNWTFPTDANPAVPTSDNNPYGDPMLTINGNGENDTFWMELGYPSGYWTINYNTYLGSSIAAVIPDSLTAGTKTVWTQLTWSSCKPPNLAVPPTVMVIDDGVDYPGEFISSTLLVDTSTTLSISQDPPIYDSVFATSLPNNPPSETVVITGTLQVSELVIDTECVPEPSTLVLLGMGALGLVARAWRKVNNKVKGS